MSATEQPEPLYKVESPQDGQSVADVILFAVKYHHLKQAVEDVRGHVGPDTIFISVMNGIDSEETIAVARRHDIHLYLEDIENLVAVLQTLSPEGKTSMCQDIEAGRKTEVEMFAGKLIELTEREAVDVPLNRTLYSLIKAKEALVSLQAS